jgi:hypothetical protein
VTGVRLVQGDPPVKEFVGNRMLNADVNVGGQHDPRHRIFLEAFTDRTGSESTIKEFKVVFGADFTSAHRVIGDADLAGFEVSHERVVRYRYTVVSLIPTPL